MNVNLQIARDIRLEHHHSDGTWSPLEPVHHDSVAHDSERSWLKRTIYRCVACNEEVAVTQGNGDDEDEPRA